MTFFSRGNDGQATFISDFIFYLLGMNGLFSDYFRTNSLTTMSDGAAVGDSPTGEVVILPITETPQPILSDSSVVDEARIHPSGAADAIPESTNTDTCTAVRNETSADGRMNSGRTNQYSGRGRYSGGRGNDSGGGGGRTPMGGRTLLPGGRSGPNVYGRGYNQAQQRMPIQVHASSGVPFGHVPAYLPGSSSLVEELDQRILLVLRDGKHIIGVSYRCIARRTGCLWYNSFSNTISAA
jgi:hypothetical protein